MGIALLVLLIVLIFGGVGFAVHVLWWIAIAAFVLWLLGFFVRGSERGRWYGW